MNITDFFKVDVCNYASYDNYRSIASVVDGLKPSSRKCLYTIMKNNVNTPKKVSQLKSDAASQTQYLHGDQSLQGVLVKMAQKFPGANNIPLLKRQGSFGNRLIPQAAAGRYIFTCKEEYLDSIYMKKDQDILERQFFQGDEIEYKFYVPILPMLLINGSNGLTTGFRQYILPRNPQDAIRYILNRMDGKRQDVKLEPFFNGFSGTVEQHPERKNAWIIRGCVRKISRTQFQVTQVPIGYTLQSYVKVLQRLQQNGQIKSFKDLSQDGRFRFRVTLSRDGGISQDDPGFMDQMGLVQVQNQFYTSMDQNNRVVQYESPEQIIDHYTDLRLKYYQMRKDSMLQGLHGQILLTLSKFLFVKGVISGDIQVSNRSDAEVIQDIRKNKNIIEHDGGFDYLLNMPVRSMTSAKYQQLKQSVIDLKAEFDDLKGKTPQQLWKNDLKQFLKAFRDSE